MVVKTNTEEDLDRMEKLGIIEKVDTSEWAVPVPCGTVGRLPYGVALALFRKLWIKCSRVCQKLLAIIIDDILVIGHTNEEHVRNLEAVFK